MTVEPKHDSVWLGPLEADPTDAAALGGKLASLADLVRLVACRKSLPLNPARAHLIEVLKAAGDALPSFYLTRPDEFAQRVGDDHKWRRRVEGRAGGMRWPRITPYFATSFIAGGDGDGGGGGGGAWGPSYRGFKIKPIAAALGRYGPAGALQTLAEAWCSPDMLTKAAAARDLGTAVERLAIPAAAVPALLGFDFGDDAEQPAIDAPAATAPARPCVLQQSEPPALIDAAESAAAASAPPWPDAKDIKGKGKLHDYWLLKGGKAGRASAQLAEHYGKSQRCIQMRIEEFNPKACPAIKRAQARSDQRDKGAAALPAVAAASPEGSALLSVVWQAPKGAGKTA